MVKASAMPPRNTVRATGGTRAKFTAWDGGRDEKYIYSTSVYTVMCMFICSQKESDWWWDEYKNTSPALLTKIPLPPKERNRRWIYTWIDRQRGVLHGILVINNRISLIRATICLPCKMSRTSVSSLQAGHLCFLVNLNLKGEVAVTVNIWLILWWIHR